MHINAFSLPAQTTASAQDGATETDDLCASGSEFAACFTNSTLAKDEEMTLPRLMTLSREPGSDLRGGTGKHAQSESTIRVLEDVSRGSETEDSETPAAVENDKASPAFTSPSGWLAVFDDRIAPPVEAQTADVASVFPTTRMTEETEETLGSPSEYPPIIASSKRFFTEVTQSTPITIDHASANIQSVRSGQPVASVRGEFDHGSNDLANRPPANSDQPERPVEVIGTKALASFTYEKDGLSSVVNNSPHKALGANPADFSSHSADHQVAEFNGHQGTSTSWTSLSPKATSLAKPEAEVSDPQFVQRPAPRAPSAPETENARPPLKAQVQEKIDTAGEAGDRKAPVVGSPETQWRIPLSAAPLPRMQTLTMTGSKEQQGAQALSKMTAHPTEAIPFEMRQKPAGAIVAKVIQNTRDEVLLTSSFHQRAIAKSPATLADPDGRLPFSAPLVVNEWSVDGTSHQADHQGKSSSPPPADLRALGTEAFQSLRIKAPIQQNKNLPLFDPMHTLAPAAALPVDAETAGTQPFPISKKLPIASIRQPDAITVKTMAFSSKSPSIDELDQMPAVVGVTEKSPMLNLEAERRQANRLTPDHHQSQILSGADDALPPETPSRKEPNTTPDARINQHRTSETLFALMVTRPTVVMPAVAAETWDDLGVISVNAVGLGSVVHNQVQTAPVLVAQHHPVLPQVFQSLLVFVQQEAGDQMNLTLNPEELGRLRFEMMSSGEKVHISLFVERGETLDLLRRNVDQLLSDLRLSGFGQASLSFGNWSQRGHSKGVQAASMSSDDTAEASGPASSVISQRQIAADGRLDLRL